MVFVKKLEDKNMKESLNFKNEKEAL